MNNLLDEINSEIDEDGWELYINNIILLENKIKLLLDEKNYNQSYQKIIRYIHLDLLWSIDVFDELIKYKVTDEIYIKNLINLI